MKPRVALTRALFPEHVALLEQSFEVRDNREDKVLGRADLIRHLQGAAGILNAGMDRIDAPMLEALPDLRVVSCVSVGYNHIDVDACTARGVMVTNTPDVLTETTADMGWALMMAAARRVTESERWLRAGHWQRWAFDQFLGAEVHHSTLGIIGMGRIGQAIARRASGFSMRVVYYNRSRLSPELETDCRATWLPMNELLASADHVMLVVPYSAASHHLIGAAELARMKPGATLTNIARGGLIDEDALAAALTSGHLASAGLDVFEGEPQVNPALLALKNVALAPHLGSASRQARDAMARLAIRNLSTALAGERPPNLVNPAPDLRIS